MIQASGCAHDPLQVLNFHVLGLFIRLRNYTEYNEVKYCLKVGGQHQGKGKLKIRKKSADRNKIANQMDVSCWFFGNLGVSNNVFFISFSPAKNSKLQPGKNESIPKPLGMSANTHSAELISFVLVFSIFLYSLNIILSASL